MTKKIFGYGILSGLLVTGIVYFLALALTAGQANVVLPVTQMSFLGTFLLSLIFFKEKMTRRKISAVALGIIALPLLTIQI